MKVAFPTNNQEKISSHIGLAKGFLIVDTDTNERIYIENPIIKKIQNEHINLKNTQEGERGLGTGLIIPPLLEEAGVDVLVSGDFGEGMIRNLAYKGIKYIETDNKNIDEVLNQIKENNMQLTNQEFGYGRGMNRGFGFRRGTGARGCRKNFGRGRGFGARPTSGRNFGYGRGRRGWED